MQITHLHDWSHFSAALVSMVQRQIAPESKSLEQLHRLGLLHLPGPELLQAATCILAQPIGSAAENLLSRDKLPATASHADSSFCTILSGPCQLR